MKANSKENKIESGMEGLKIGDQEQGVMPDQSSDKPRMRRGWRHHHKCGMNEAGAPEGKHPWREMRRHRMAMRQAMMDEGAWGDFPMHGPWGSHGMMHPPMMGPPPPPMMYGFPHGPHHGRRHFHQRFSPMMYGGPHSNQFEGDFGPTMGGRPPFHPRMMAMMMMMSMFAGTGMGCHGKKKCCENTTDSADEGEPKDQSQGRRKCKKENSCEGMPPFMMAPWMFRGQRFRKCMSKDSCCQKESEDYNEKQTKGNDSDFESRIDAKDEAGTNETEGEERFGPKQQMRIMKRIMAMNGGFPPMMAMYPGAMYPPGMMHRFMQKKRCQHKKKCDKSESDDSPSSGEETEIIDNVSEDVATENLAQSSEAFEMLGASSNLNDGETVEEDDNMKDKDHKKKSVHQNRRRQQMRAMMMNGGFPPMWAMMSHRGCHNKCSHKGRKGKSHKSQDVEDHKQCGEDNLMS